MATGGEYWAELYDLPHVGTTKRGELDILRGGLEKMIGQIKGGKLTIPARTRAGTDLDLNTLLDNGSNVGRLIKIMQATGAGPGGTERFAVRVDRVSKPYTEKSGLVVDLSGTGVEGYLQESSLPNKDRPTSPTRDPDHIYGAASILANGDIEQNVASNAVIKIWNDGTGGTFTLSDGTDTTSAIAHHTSFDVIATRLETDITSIVDVRVSGAGTFENPWIIEYINPGGVAVPLLTANDTNLTPTGSLSRISQVTAGGVLAPTGWTPSYNPQTGIAHGIVSILRPSTLEAHTGTYSMQVVSQPLGNDPPGAQQIVPVNGDATYRGGIWVKSATAQTFRLVVRTLDETFIAGVDVAASANTWTQLTLPPFEVFPWVSQVIYRIASLYTGGVVTWFFDTAEFAPGLPAAAAGVIINDVLDAYQADGQLTFLGRGFTDTLDSGGVAWVDSALAMTIQRGRSLKQVLDVLTAWRYQWLVNPDGAGGYKLDIWNPGGAGTDKSATVALHSAQRAFESATRERNVPKANRVHVEGAAGLWTVAEDTGKKTGFGARTIYAPFSQVGDSVTLVSLAAGLLAEHNARAKGTKLKLRDDDDLRALEHVTFGDRITIDLPPEARSTERFLGLTLTLNEGRATRADIHMEREVLSQAEADTQAILRILGKFTGNPPPPTSVTSAITPAIIEPTTVIGSGHVFVLVAASNSRPDVIAQAEFKCDGTNDEVEILAAFQFVQPYGGTILLAAGDYYIGATIHLTGPTEGSITFLGDGHAIIHHTTGIPSSTNGRWIFDIHDAVSSGAAPAPTLTFDGITFDGENIANSAGITTHGPSLSFHFDIFRCHFTRFDGRFLFADSGGNQYEIHSCLFDYSSLDGGAVESPGMTGIQFNSGSSNYRVDLHDCLFDEVIVGSNITYIININSFAGIDSQIHHNNFLNCSANAIYPGTAFETHNVINGVHVAGEHSGTITGVVSNTQANAKGDMLRASANDVWATETIGPNETFDVADSTQTLGIKQVQRHRTLNVNTIAVGNVGTGEDDLQTFSVPAAVLAANGDYLEVEAAGRFAASANNKRLRLNYGATTIFDTGALAITAASDWQLRGKIIRTGAATQKAIIEFSCSDTTVNPVPDYTTPAETLSGAVILKTTGEATANDDVVAELMVTGLIPVA